MENSLLNKKLKEIFGYEQFRGNQKKIISNLLENKNGLVIMPTGSGKSLCYQLPAILKEGTAIVISPLIALMKDQVDFLKSIGVNAAFLNSTLSKKVVNQMKEDLSSGIIKLLYIAPESFTKQETLDFLNTLKLSFVAIDETHCISDWGHDFRPEYRKIRQSINSLGTLPIIALTATATTRVQKDIIKNLEIENSQFFKSSFDRKNLHYLVKPKIEADKQIAQYIKKNQGQAGIIYCHSRKTVEKLAEFLSINGIKAAPYHAGLDSNSRIKNQESFIKEEIDIIVATIAFGMGIDKPDVRFVIHYDMPKSLEGYYQETGRAGRDGLRSLCILFYSSKDATKLEKFNKDKPVSEKINAKTLIQEVKKYAICPICRRKQLLYYFGEEYSGNCNNCDNCIYPSKQYEGQHLAEIVLKTLIELKDLFTEEHISNFIYGEITSNIDSYEHQKLITFGIGKKYGNADHWSSIIQQVMIKGFIKRNDKYELIITQKGILFLKEPYSLKFLKTKDYSNDEVLNNLENHDKIIDGSGELYCDDIFLKSLHELRSSVAKKNNIMSYLVFPDSVIEEMALLFPTSIESLSRISNVGTSKAKKFGLEFIDLIKKYVDDNNIEPATQILSKPDNINQKERLYIIKQIDRRVSLEEIANSKSIEVNELISKIEQICYSGVKLNLNYYIDRFMERDRQEEVFEYFQEATADDVNKAMMDLEDEYDESEVRLMHIKFISEVAN